MSPKVPQLIFATAVIVALAALVSGKSEAKGKEMFRIDTFSGLHKVVQQKSDPTTALKLGATRAWLPGRRGPRA